MRKLLASCDRRRTIGRRDYADRVVALEAGAASWRGRRDPAGLDVDWRAGEVLIRGKGSRAGRCWPITGGRSVRALVSYLRRRPRCESRRLFSRMTAPLQGLAPHTVGWIVCRRAPGGASARSAHRSGIPRRPRCSGRARRWRRSARCCATASRRRPPYTPRSTAERSARSRAVAVTARWRCSMSPLREALADYLRLRRQLGFEMPQDGRLLEGFVEFLKQAGAERITTELALEWHGCRRARTARIGAAAVGRCADSRAISRRSTPPARFPPRTVARPPAADCPIHLHRAGDRGADRGRRKTSPPLRAARHQTLIGLLAVTGMRPGKHSRSTATTSTFATAWCTSAPAAEETTPGAAAPSTIRALRDYARLRDARFPEPSTPAFFIGARGRRIPRGELNRTFTQLIREVGLDGRGARASTPPHDLRHALAVHTLVGWFEAGENIDRRMPLLSAFLGHVDPASSSGIWRQSPSCSS